MAWPDVSCRALALLHLWVEFADGDTQLGPRFEHLSSGADQGKVLIVGDLDQPIEHRVMKDLPPVAILLIAGVDRRVAGFEPFLGHRGRRRRKIGPDHTTDALKQQRCGEHMPTDGVYANRHASASLIHNCRGPSSERERHSLPRG